MKLKNLCALFMGFVLGMVGVAAHAEIPASVATTLTSIEADASSLQGLVVPVVLAVLGMTLVIKLIKRFANKI